MGRLASIFIIGAVATLSSNANAEFVFFQKEVDNVTSSLVPQKFINSTSLSLGISAGLDRKLKLELVNSTGLVIYTTTTGMVTVDDRISNPVGNDFYGKVISLPELTDQESYTVTQTVLDGKSNEIKSESYEFTVDEDGVSLSDFRVLYVNGEYDRPTFQYNGQQVLSSRNTERITSVSAFTGAPIQSATFTTYFNDNGNWVKYAEQDAYTNGSELYLRNNQLTAPYNGIAKFLPSNSTSEVRVQLAVVDQAGNKNIISKTYPWATCRINNVAITSEMRDDFVGISSPGSSGIPGISNTAGFKSFKKGEPITANPAEFIVRVPLEYSRFKLPMFGWSPRFAQLNTAYDPVSVDANYAYYKQGNIQVESNGQLIGRRLMSPGGYCTGYLDAGTNFTAETLPPEMTDFYMTLDDGREIRVSGTSNDTNGVYTITKGVRNSLPTGSYYELGFGNNSGVESIKSGRFVTKIREYPQTVYSNIDTSKRCTIPAGETECSVMYDRTLKSLNKLYIHSNYGAVSINASNPSIKDGYTIIFKVDTDDPIIVDHDFSEETLKFSGKVWNRDVEDVYRNYYISNAIVNAKDIDTGEVVTFKAKVERIDGTYYKFSGDVSSLPEGRFELDVTVYDSFGNYTTETLGSVTTDKTEPEISVTVEGDAFVNNSLIMGLESLKIDVDDMSQHQLDGVIIRGGPASDELRLDFVNVGDTTYTLEYPRLFPSLEPDQNYFLDITASDEFGNVAHKTIQLKYVPANTIQIEDRKILTTSQILKDRNNVPIYQIVSSELRDNSGQIITGSVPVVFTLRSDADFSVLVNAQTVKPGQSVQWDLNISTDGKVYLPVTPAVDNVEGKANFMFEMTNVTFVE
ncbi:DUF4165 domain-containing protein [Vibrio parahaemolyticus]|uniref:Ig-like domain-containing protein n=1 Tax=Vibrio TaxID=662 RepID=UPI001A8D1B67|nr:MULTISPECIES: Ig-like domain-containing protein [Vibrio]EGQ7973454.1 DUF4165 domain-containing protein [Vibrio parahaemolyticus]MBO0208644.1 DUF4165 domain-containing protein [Vibrio sp. Vb0877]MCR9810893.1 Ig-like domain-containing protein [Vibrio parahaemolyticus]